MGSTQWAVVLRIATCIVLVLGMLEERVFCMFMFGNILTSEGLLAQDEGEGNRS